VRRGRAGFVRGLSLFAGWRLGRWLYAASRSPPPVARLPLPDFRSRLPVSSFRPVLPAPVPQLPFPALCSSAAISRRPFLAARRRCTSRPCSRSPPPFSGFPLPGSCCPACGARIRCPPPGCPTPLPASVARLHCSALVPRLPFPRVLLPPATRALHVPAALPFLTSRSPAFRSAASRSPAPCPPAPVPSTCSPTPPQPLPPSPSRSLPASLPLPAFRCPPSVPRLPFPSSVPGFGSRQPREGAARPAVLPAPTSRSTRCRATRSPRPATTNRQPSRPRCSPR